VDVVTANPRLNGEEKRKIVDENARRLLRL
jgi:predicted TIM-barrel fold metal-dependent hydrolase